MNIWVDADACPGPIKDMLFRAAERWRVMVTLVANQSLYVPSSSHIRMLQVARGFDVADDEIVQRVEAGDLVISADIPLAAEVIEKGGHVLNTRGEMLSKNNIQARLNMRDFMDTLRASGVDTGGPTAFSHADRHAFASKLDRFLARHCS